MSNKKNNLVSGTYGCSTVALRAIEACGWWQCPKCKLFGDSQGRQTRMS